MVGNFKDGFRVIFGVLIEMDKKVNEMLGINLVLAERLKDKALQQPGIPYRLVGLMTYANIC